MERRISLFNGRKNMVSLRLLTRIENHTFRATGITAYLKNKGTLEAAQPIANHESPRTTNIYESRQDEISLAEVEGIAI